MTLQPQAELLAALGASPEETVELLAYNDNVFDLGAVETLRERLRIENG